MRLAALGLLIWSMALPAQAQQPPASISEQQTLVAAIRAEPSGEEATVTFFNRPITVFRARILGRGPAERAANVTRTLQDLVAEGGPHPVQTRMLDEAGLITVRGRMLLALTPADIDALSGETLAAATNTAAQRLQQALDAAEESRRPTRLLRSALVVLGATGATLLVVFVISRGHRAAAARLAHLAEISVSKSRIADVHLLRASRLIELQQRLLSFLAVVLYLVISYSLITFALRQFPFTRPWGEAMRGFLLQTVQNVGLGFARAIPGLVTVAIILLLTRFVVRLIGLWFHAIERGSIATPRWLHPETIQPTRRLLTAGAWIFAVVLVYPYIPGSQTDAFKGVSVLLGLMLTLGSSGLMTQIMSSFMITYSRALRVGDFVRVGEVEGTVTYLGLLSTKVRTVFGEEVTIPNALVISQTTTDFSRFDENGVFTPTSVTIGYDVPWRQVHSLLLMAAARTQGILREPQPLVMQAGLEDFYVKYTLWFSLERQALRAPVMSALHQNIQDLFNEYGVQIMSPHYLSDPASPKVVPAQKWFTAPAHPKEVSTR